eukprot:gene4509-5622_t
MFGLTKSFQASLNISKCTPILKNICYVSINNNNQRFYSTQPQQQEQQPQQHQDIFSESVDFPVVGFNSKQNVGNVKLLKSIFSVPLRVDLLHRMVRWQRAKAQQGTHEAQNMSDKDRSGKKPFNQKGTGNARQGTNHAVQMKGGARAFPPKPRDHSHGLPKKVRKLCLKVALSAKLAQNKLVIIDNFNLKSHKTKELHSNVPEEWGKPLFVDSEISTELSRASLNSRRIDTIPERGLNVYSMLLKDTLVLTVDSLEKLQKRLL